MPRVSVIMPVYNCAPFLREAVGSVLAQTFRDFELIVVDDASSDRSWEMLQALPDKRVRRFRLEKNHGVTTARGYAVEHADCEYLAFLDADDIANPARLQIQVDCLRSRANLGAVGSRAWILHSGRVRSTQLREPLKPDEVSATLLFRNCIVQSSVLMRRNEWQPLRKNCEAASDYDLWARLSPPLRFGVLKRVLVTYRDHSNGISKRRPDQIERGVRQIHQFQLERLGLLPKLYLHAMLSAWPLEADAQQLSEAELWLQEILRANRIYDPPSLRRVIERVWFTICLDSWLLGPRAFCMYRRSPLAKLTPVRMARFFRRFGRRAFAGQQVGARDFALG
jgi:glycosyltransferase involved in cell wall biosynthesis